MNGNNNLNSLEPSQTSCAACGTTGGKLSRCGGCKVVLYCSKRCQKKDWKDGHKEVCKTAQQQIKNMMTEAKSAEPRSENYTWKLFLPKATLENVLEIYVDEEAGLWELRLEQNSLVVVDTCSPFKDYEETLVGRGPFPDSKEDLVTALFACMISPFEDQIPRRPQSIQVTTEILAKVDYKYLWSEMLRLRMQVWRKENEEDEEAKMSLRCFPLKRWGTYAQGETFYEPQLKLRIEWLSNEKRREIFESENGDYENYLDCVYFRCDITKRRRWEWLEYDSLEESLECEETSREFMSEVVHEWQADDPDSTLTIEDICMEDNGAKTPEECVWDSFGVPRLSTEDDNADKLLQARGFKCCGYKPGRFYVLNEDSVQLGRRLIEYGGFFWEETRRTAETRDELFEMCAAAGMYS